MRKKLLSLALALTAVAVALPTRSAEADVYCPQCTTSGGVRCCTDCWCGPSGITNCTAHLVCEGDV